MRNPRIHYKPSLALESKDQELLALLSKHKKGRIRINVASNPNTSFSILWKMLDDKNAQVLIALAERCSTFNMIEALMDKKIHDVIVALSKNKNLPFYFQLKLLRNDEWISYFMHIGRHTTHKDIIDYILNYDFSHYRDHARLSYIRLIHNKNLNQIQFEKLYSIFIKLPHYYRGLAHEFLIHPKSTKKILLSLMKIYPSYKRFVYEKLGLDNFV